MTSPSRRNRRTTPPNTLPLSQTELANQGPAVQVARWCVLAMLVALSQTDASSAQGIPLDRFGRTLAPALPPQRVRDAARPAVRQASAIQAEPVSQAPLPIIPPVAEPEIFQQEDSAEPLPTEDPFRDDPLSLDSTALRNATLRSITEIEPFFDYEPDPQIRRNDPQRNLCPRPDGDASEDLPTCPAVLSLPGGEGPYAPRVIPPSVYAWTASNLHYNPLYFEDVVLERYGHTYPCYIQPFDSIALFSLQLVGLPYQMTLDPVCKCIYPLGYYRPGECIPKLHYQIPLNARAAVNQAAVTTGMFYLIP